VKQLSDLVTNELSEKIQDVMREQRQIRTNEHRNYSVVRSTESRIVWFAILESIAIVGLAIAQVYVIQTFFAKSGRLRV
jgi:hypothetical protein